MGRAGGVRHLALQLELVDRDDLACPADARTLDDRQPDAAAAEHRHGLPGLQRGAAQRRADAGQHAAADQRGAVQRQVRIDPHDRILVQQHVFGVAADAGERAARRAVLRDAAASPILGRATMPPVHRFGCPLRHCGQVPQKPDRHATTWSPGPHRRHVGADRLDDAGALVAQDERPIEREPAETVHHVQVAVADAGGDRLHQDLPAPRLVEFYRFDRQWFVHFAKHGCVGFHGIRLSCRCAGVGFTIGRQARGGNRGAGRSAGLITADARATLSPSWPGLSRPSAHHGRSADGRHRAGHDGGTVRRGRQIREVKLQPRSAAVPAASSTPSAVTATL